MQSAKDLEVITTQGNVKGNQLYSSTTTKR